MRDWLARFETTLRALPEKQRQASLLPLLHNYQKPEPPDQRVSGAGGSLPGGRAGRTRSGRTRTSRTSPQPVIVKYITDLELLGLL